MTFDRETNPGVVPLPDPAREGLPSREVKSYVHPLTNDEEVRKEHRAPKARVIKVSRTLVTLFVINITFVPSPASQLIPPLPALAGQWPQRHLQ